MAFDLDEDELRATREMHKLSDKNVAKDDIHKLNKFCEYEDAVVLCEEALYEIQEAIERILSEREQDKARIKELEEENYIQKVALLENSIPKQKVKDEIKELKIQGNYKTFYNPNGRTHFLKEESDYKIEVLEKLLQESEDK